ncbi:MAG: hypothetical protein QM582_11470 [Micropruina sp.]|uniref:hypothetical protein n=1 Tax=Micropruina sp. TaxID=2737536 RepID=UPI0039E445D2
MNATASWGRAGRVLAWAAAAVLAITVALGVLGAVRGPVLPAPTVAAPTPGPASILPSRPARWVDVDSLTRRLTVAPYLSGQLPGKPFTFAQPTSTTGLFTEVTLGAVADDPGWRQNKNLPVGVLVADLEPKTVVAGDLDATGRGVLAEFGRRVYNALSDLQVADLRSDPETAIGSFPARWSHATVTGGLGDGTVERAELSMLLVALPNGRHFALVEIRPNHPGASQHFAAMDRAAASIVATG